MQNNEQIINRVAQSPVLTFDLELIRPKIPRVSMDVAHLLYQGLILREKDFREFVQSYDWKSLDSKAVAIHCSADAVVPQWAFAVLAANAAQFASIVIFGTLEDLEIELFYQEIEKMDLSPYANKVVVIKGCSEKAIPQQAYVRAAAKLATVARKILYGEPCSAVPVFKR